MALADWKEEREEEEDEEERESVVVAPVSRLVMVEFAYKGFRRNREARQ